MADSLDKQIEARFRKYNGDELADLILLRTNQMYNYPFWLREQTACFEDPEIAYAVALNLEDSGSLATP